MNPVDLLNDGKIDKYEYDTYLMFGSYDFGAQYLKNVFEDVCMEESPEISECSYSRKDGRISVWRDIKNVVNKVEFLLENSQEV